MQIGMHISHLLFSVGGIPGCEGHFSARAVSAEGLRDAATKRSGLTTAMAVLARANQLLRRFAYRPPARAGALSCSRWICTSGTTDKAHANRAPAGDLPGVELPTAGCSPSR